jgi:hypothetical protein
MKKSGKGALRKYLKTLPEEVCREQILELWDRFPAVRDYFSSRLAAGGGSEILYKAKAAIAREFSRVSSVGRPAVARKIITDFRASHVRTEALIELLLFYVDVGVEYITGLGDDHPTSSVVTSFREALELASREDLIEVLQPQFEAVVGRARGAGWGLYELLDDEWAQYEPWDEDEGEGEKP